MVSICKVYVNEQKFCYATNMLHRLKRLRLKNVKPLLGCIEKRVFYCHEAMRAPLGGVS